MKFLENEFNGAYQVVIEQVKEFASRKGNELFKQKLEKSTQTSQDLIKYITGEARKQASNGVAMISDEEVVGWAIHFVDENIHQKESKSNSKPSEAAVVVSKEIKEANDKFVAEAIKKAKSQTKQTKKEKAVKQEPAGQISIFDLLD